MVPRVEATSEVQGAGNKPSLTGGTRVLVTGASGFIGGHLCKRLLAEGAIVQAVSRVRQVSNSSRLSWIQGDLTEIETVRELFKKGRPELVFHLASHVMGAPGLEHVLPTFHHNLQTTVNLLVGAAEFGARRLVLTGSLVEPEPGQMEKVPPAPYAAAKWAAGDYARMFHALYHVPATIARVFMVYGPGQTDTTKLIPYVILSALKGQKPRITSGERLIDWVFVDDVVSAFLFMANTPGIEGKTVDIGSGVLISIREIVQRTLAFVGVNVDAEFGALPERPMEPKRVADIAASMESIGWAPSTNLDDGLGQTVEWYRSKRAG